MKVGASEKQNGLLCHLADIDPTAEAYLSTVLIPTYLFSYQKQGINRQLIWWAAKLPGSTMTMWLPRNLKSECLL